MVSADVINYKILCARTRVKKSFTEMYTQYIMCECVCAMNEMDAKLTLTTSVTHH